jgi:hypothetical protein
MKMLKKRTTRAKPANSVKMPLQPDLYESFLLKYMGVRYSTREMTLKKPFTRSHKIFFFSALSDRDVLKDFVAETPSSCLDSL